MSRPESGQQQGNISQLISLLQSFGLRLSGPGVPPGPAASCAPQPATVVHADAGTQTSLIDSEEVSGSDPGGGWTLVRGRHGTRKTQDAVPSPGGVTPPGTAPRPAGTAVMEALRRGEEERRVREAKRARLAEKAKEVRSSPGADTVLASSATQSPTSPSTTSAATSAMGPPPLPPPPPRLRGLPSSQSSGPPRKAPPAEPPPSTPAPLEPPPDPGRPPKRGMPWGGSPTEGGSPRTRQKYQTSPRGGRASSADGRLSRSSLHPRVQFRGTGASSDIGERF